MIRLAPQQVTQTITVGDAIATDPLSLPSVEKVILQLW